MLYNHFYFLLINQEPEHNFGDHQKLVSISKQHRKLADEWKYAEETWNMNMKMLTTMMISKVTMTKMTKTKRGRDKKQGARRWKWRKPCHRLLPSPSNKHKAPSIMTMTTMTIDDNQNMKDLATGSSPPPAPSTAPTDRRSTKPAFENIWGTTWHTWHLSKKFCDHSFWGKKTPKRVFWDKTYEKHLFFTLYCLFVHTFYLELEGITK